MVIIVKGIIIVKSIIIRKIEQENFTQWIYDWIIRKKYNIVVVEVIIIILIITEFHFMF